MHNQRLTILAFISLGIVSTFLPFEVIGGRVGRGIDSGNVGVIMNFIYIIAGALAAFVPNIYSAFSMKNRVVVLSHFLLNASFLIRHYLKLNSIQFEPLLPGMPANSGEVSLGIGYYIAWTAILGGIFFLFYKFRNRLTK